MNNRVYTPGERFTVTSEYTRGTGHSLYAKVVISVDPAPSFSFRSEAAWPLESYEDAIRQGMLEELAGRRARLCAELVLREIDWRDRESCWDSYYQAAKQAAREILRKIEVAP